jgi:hypothetical protein
VGRSVYFCRHLDGLRIFGAGDLWTAHSGSGIAAWTIILTIIAMYVAGLETARLAGVSTRRDGVAHGVMMFGLAITSAMVVVFYRTLL